MRLNEVGFTDLSQVERLQHLDQLFLERLRAQNAVLYSQLLVYRQAEAPLTPLETSELLLGCAPYLEDFIAELFSIEKELENSQAATISHNVVLVFKKLFVQRRVRHLINAEITDSFADLDHWLSEALANSHRTNTDREHAVATFAEYLLKDPTAHAKDIERLTHWCIRALTDPQASNSVQGWVSFTFPQPLNYSRLVPLRRTADDGSLHSEALTGERRRRDGFKLTDLRMSARDVQDQVHYCIYCHTHDGDFCSKGFPEKKAKPELGFKKNPLDILLTGCPLEEKISEMHALKRDGHTIGALAMAMVDNPMIPATGHRICNDCMKSCIYQKQDPVDIPQIETRCLTDVLELPWGVEIYDLLTRWNPLRQRQYLPKPCNGKKVLIAGMGPAGFTLAHHLTMEGCAVVGIDGLKIEPLPDVLLKQPIRHYATLMEALDARVMTGFGGVAEYGITVRWDKNFLKLIYLSLLRRPNFQVFGGVRLGGTLTLDDAWALGFDHVGIAMGAGLPKVVPMENSLARGMRQASDFLMALQLTGAAKATSLTNLQVRLPALVIGGGLTAIDTATEVQAYYITQVEKTLARYETLAQAFGEARIRSQLDEESSGILEEFLEHGRAVRAERARATKCGETPNFLPLLRAWGGVTVAYRQTINQSPAYLRNHEEVTKALEEGILYAEGLEPLRAKLDRFGHVEALVFHQREQNENGVWVTLAEDVNLPARAVFIAAGAIPNTIYEREHPGTFTMQATHFLPHSGNAGALQPHSAAAHPKQPDFGPFTSYNKDGHRVSFLGDTHPVFAGSVVKAIASAMRIYPHIMAGLADLPSGTAQSDYADFRAHMVDLLQPRVTRVKRHSPSVVEVQVRAPMAARNFRPGQFFRLQNFESQSLLVEGSRLQTEAIALTGVPMQGSSDCISLMVLEVGASSRLCATFHEGDPIVLMGPTGKATEIPYRQTILVAGGRRGAAVMVSLGPALRQAGNRVIYFAGFRTADELYLEDRLEDAADVVVWCTASGPAIAPRRPQDRALSGDFIDIVCRYAEGMLESQGGEPSFNLKQVDRILAIGSERLLRMVQTELKGRLKNHFSKDVEVTGSVGSPMQCMLQGVCAQCLQWQIDPVTGKRMRAVFSCAGQDQPLDWVDLDNLDARLAQNRLPEHLTNLWLDYLFARSAIKHV
jgi:NADPH-dependent glutamate synthase beta subunit-like oxidoreductase/NAD(P)H-flavin reductase